jgi:mRNA interferase MazF
MKSSFAKGEIVFAQLGKPPEEIKGHEQAFERPCVIIKAINNLELAIIIPLTTKPKSSIFTFVKLPEGSGSLQKESFALCHQIRTISIDRIQRKIGKLELHDVLKIDSVLRDMLEL